MKTFTFLAFATAIGLMHPVLSNGQDITDGFAISWRGTFHFNDGTGKAVSRTYTEKDAVKMIADANSMNANDLILVYRPTQFDTAVINKSTGVFIADYLQLPDISRLGTAAVTDVTGNGQTVRQAFLFDELTNPIGSIVGTEKQKSDAQGNLTSESFHGTFQYAIPDGTHHLAQGVYSGSFSTGRHYKVVQ